MKQHSADLRERLLGAIAAGSPASAGSFKVNPVNLAMPADRSTTSLSLANSGSEPVSVRVLTYRWTQVGGDDVSSPRRSLRSILARPSSCAWA